MGEGGFGITYKGAHKALRQSVAIKEFFPAGAVRQGAAVSVPAPQQTAFERERANVLQEARLLFGLRAPSIVNVYDAFRENNTAYIVMEYLDGQTLGARLERVGRLSLDEVRRIARAVCEALTEMHARQLLHRDIKPDNIMLTPEGRTVLIDFGSARTFRAGQTGSHTLILTPGYAAPEQYSTLARFGPYTDVFSLGATLYHALIGQPPPPAIDRLHNAVQAVHFPSPLPDPLYAALRQALELRVDARPQTVADFLQLALPQATAAAGPQPPPPVTTAVIPAEYFACAFAASGSFSHQISVAGSRDGRYRVTGRHPNHGYGTLYEFAYNPKRWCAASNADVCRNRQPADLYAYDGSDRNSDG